MSARFPVFCVSLLLAFPALAQVTLPSVFSDHMVVQRDLPLHVWGDAAPGEHVSVEFHGNSGNAVADELGKWSVHLAPVAAGGSASTLTVKGASKTLTINDVAVGDVWVASGQSNMEFSMSDLADAATEIAAASDPNIRYLRVLHKPADYPRTDAAVEPWTAVTPQTARTFSAAAYYFAREIEARQHVPIGIIETAWGGSVAEAWTSMRALSADASLMPVFNAWANMQEKEGTQVLQDHADAALKAAGKLVPERDWHPELHSWAPSELYNGMIAPFTPFAIRGVIWYQGESNSRTDRFSTYHVLFPAMIRDWRKQWDQGDFPFLFVQISSFGSGNGEEWPMVREAQFETLQLRNTGMAVTTDIGNPTDVHPKNKKDVGHRLALAARAITYGENIEYSGPLFRTATRDPKGVRVWFDHVGTGLLARDGTLKAFEIAGADGKFVPAQAIIEGNTLLVSSTAVADPKYVRYDWANSPDGNLFNREGLPASQFRGEVK